MRKENIAKAFVIAGVVLILACLVMNYFFVRDGVLFTAGKINNAVSIASEYSQKGESTAWDNLRFIFTNGTVILSDMKTTLYLGALLDLLILAQAIMMILVGLRDLSKP